MWLEKSYSPKTDWVVSVELREKKKLRWRRGASIGNSEEEASEVGGNSGKHILDVEESVQIGGNKSCKILLRSQLRWKLEIYQHIQQVKVTDDWREHFMQLI